MIPSYGGWISFWGIPIHAWNMDTFIQIGNACGVLEEVDKVTMDMVNLNEAKIKVKYNYYGFIPTAIRIKDKDDHFFRSTHTVTICSGKWLAKRDVKIHGPFKRQAAIDFDDFNPIKAEQFIFVGDLAIPTGEFEKLKNRALMAELTKEEDPTLAKDIYERD